MNKDPRDGGVIIKEPERSCFSSPVQKGGRGAHIFLLMNNRKCFMVVERKRFRASAASWRRQVGIYREFKKIERSPQKKMCGLKLTRLVRSHILSMTFFGGLFMCLSYPAPSLLITLEHESKLNPVCGYEFS